MIIRRDKRTKRIIKSAIKFIIVKRYKSSEQKMLKAGVSDLIIDQILYEPQNVREDDLVKTQSKIKS